MEPILRMAPAVAGLDWRTLAGLPAFAEFHRLMRRLFGMNIALVSPDGSQAVLLGPGGVPNPYCEAIQSAAGGQARCLACDREHAMAVTRSGAARRYVCHAGLTEFIIPILAGQQVIGLLQCGQVLDRPPDAADWKQVRRRLGWRAGDLRPLAQAFRRTRVLSAATQEDLISLLKLFAHHAATAHAQSLLLARPAQDQAVARALAYLQQHFRDALPLDRVAGAVGISRRNLTRLLRQHTGATLVEHLHRLRIAHACELLARTGAKVAEIALAAGFGSIQQFNRVFRARTGRSPADFRAAARPAG